MRPFSIVRAITVLILVLGLYSSNHAYAQQVAYEGFDYPGDTRLEEQVGGFGWTSSWDHGTLSPYFLRDTGLNWSDSNGNALSVSGGTMFDSGGSQGNTATRDYDSSGLFDDGSEVWTSFLINSDTTNAVWMYPFADGDLVNPRSGLGSFPTVVAFVFDTKTSMGSMVKALPLILTMALHIWCWVASISSICKTTNSPSG